LKGHHLSKKRTLDEVSQERPEQEEEKKIGNFQQVKEVLQCIICVEDLKEKKAIIDCGHAFCLECIEKWSTIENTCPYCKKEFTKITEKRVGAPLLNSRKSQGLYKRRPKNQGFISGSTALKKTKTISSSKDSSAMNEKSSAAECLDQESESEVLNVIQVEKKKQRVNDQYMNDEGDIQDDEYYDDEDYGDYDDESSGEYERLTGHSN
jgi:hypothetical protein